MLILELRPLPASFREVLDFYGWLLLAEVDMAATLYLFDVDVLPADVHQLVFEPVESYVDS